MAGFTVDLPLHIQAGAPGTVMLGSNVRVKGQLGFIGLQTDALTFANGGAGFWSVANLRTRASGVFIISQTAIGQATVPPGVAVPVTVISGDPRIRSM